jgi:Ca2+-binding EF-hand superfamily protein
MSDIAFTTLKARCSISASSRWQLGLFLASLCLLALSSGFAPISAADKPDPGFVGPIYVPTSDVQDVLFLGADRPIRIRLHIRLNGQAFRQAWNDYLRSLFDYLDVDRDGVLNQQEASRVPNLQTLESILNGNQIFTFRQEVQTTAPFAQLDTNKDGRVTLSELKAYYGTFPLVQLRDGPNKGMSQRLSEALFAHLDLNHDGKLSKEELAKAEESLAKLDLNEDEMIEVDELLPGSRNGFGGDFFFYGMRPKSPSSLLLLQDGEDTSRLVSLLLKHYDKKKKGKLNREDCKLDEAVFKQLDRNANGELEPGELVGWFQQPPDLELLVQLRNASGKDPLGLGKLAAKFLGDGSIAVHNPMNRCMPLAGKLQQTDRKTALLTDGSTLLDMQRAATRPEGNNVDSLRGAVLQQFKGALGDRKSLGKKEGLQHPFISGFFTLADANNDGELTEKELNAFFDVHAKGAGSFITLSISDHGRALFKLLDTDRDNRLSILELRSAWKVLEPWDTNRDGCICSEEVPQQFELLFTQGSANTPIRYEGGLYREPPKGPAARKDGPLWFRRMDRNNDGVVSRREFLGSDEDFRRIDTNGDGLIDPKEAWAADKWFKEKMAKGN